MTLLVDTSVWSLALRCDVTATQPEVDALKAALAGSDVVVTTGLVLQELLQGFAGPKSRTQIVESFASLPLSSQTEKIISLPQIYAIHAGKLEFKSAQLTH